MPGLLLSTRGCEQDCGLSVSRAGFAVQRVLLHQSPFDRPSRTGEAPARHIPALRASVNGLRRNRVSSSLCRCRRDLLPRSTCQPPPLRLAVLDRAAYTRSPEAITASPLTVRFVAYSVCRGSGEPGTIVPGVARGLSSSARPGPSSNGDLKMRINLFVVATLVLLAVAGALYAGAFSATSDSASSDSASSDSASSDSASSDPASSDPASSCCSAGAECCFPGSPCCDDSRSPKLLCCYPPQECCLEAGK